MKTITLVAFRRPVYTDQALRRLSECRRLADFDHLMIFIDPGYEEVVEVCQGWARRFPIDARVFVNETRLGVAGNPLRAYSHAFGNLESDFHVAIEDDALLSPDALELALWYYNEHGSEAERYAFFNLCDHYDYRGAERNRWNLPEDPSLIAESVNLSSPFAWCISRLQWPFIENNWDKNTRSIGGWDWSLRFAMRVEGKVALTPVLSRCQNIGEQDGTWEDGSTFWVQRGLNYSNGAHQGGFTLVNRVTPKEARRLARWMIPELPRYFSGTK